MRNAASGACCGRWPVADRISERCFDLAIGLYACSDSTIEYCGTIRRLVRGLEDELLAARAQLREVAASGVEVETRQYVTVQIDPETWRKIQAVARG